MVGTWLIETLQKGSGKVLLSSLYKLLRLKYDIFIKTNNRDSCWMTYRSLTKGNRPSTVELHIKIAFDKNRAFKWRLTVEMVGPRAFKEKYSFRMKIS
jgi:hypothetical protein